MAPGERLKEDGKPVEAGVEGAPLLVDRLDGSEGFDELEELDESERMSECIPELVHWIDELDVLY